MSRCAIRNYDRLSQDLFIHSLFAGHIDLPFVFQRWVYSGVVITSKRVLGLVAVYVYPTVYVYPGVSHGHTELAVLNCVIEQQSVVH